MAERAGMTEKLKEIVREGPLPGADGEAILARIGYDATRIAALAQAGVVRLGAGT